MSVHNLILTLLAVEKHRYAHQYIFFLMKGMFSINKMSQFEMVIITWTGKRF